MFFTMGVSLYTTRIVLNALGVVDFGIYNVVGGVVSMLAFLSASMATATQRFFSFELGKKNHLQLNKIFCMSVNIHAIIALFVLLVAESIGLWFLNNKLMIPLDRIEAANWVYQFSVASFIVTIMGVPYNATIISNERMKIYAYISIIDVLMKLIIVFSLLWIRYDKLKIYAVLTFFVTVIIFMIYKVYCKRNFTSSNFKLYWDKKLFITLLNYSGWNLFGSAAGITMGQGVNILLNIFFGPTVNAARGVAFQVRGAVNMLVTNFQVAINPQIVKSFASNDLKYMHQIIFQGSKFSFFLLYIFALPILIETEFILNLWLNNVPEYTIIFTRLALVNVLIDSLSGPLMSAAQASGNIKKYQAVVGGLLLLILPLSYVFLKVGFGPEITLYISILISIIAMLVRLHIISSLVGFPIISFMKKVLVRIVLVAVISILSPLVLIQMMEYDLTRTIFVLSCSLISVLFSVYWFGITDKERGLIRKELKNLLIKI